MLRLPLSERFYSTTKPIQINRIEFFLVLYKCLKSDKSFVYFCTKNPSALEEAEHETTETIYCNSFQSKQNDEKNIIKTKVNGTNISYWYCGTFLITNAFHSCCWSLIPPNHLMVYLFALQTKIYLT